MKKLILPILLTAVILSCNGVKQISLSNEEFTSISEVSDKMDKYNVYVHGGSSTYRLDNPDFEQDSLKGELTKVDNGTFIENPVKPSEFNQSKKDIHVYLDLSDEELAQFAKDPKSVKKAFDRKTVKEVKMIARDEGSAFATAGIIILAVIIGMLLVWLIALAIAKSAEESSDGSDSNSNSDSGDGGDGGGTGGGGGSDSGGSDSGGSDSGGGSGCYIATMVYGSYDAPKVMVLRAFRDQFLAKYTWGNKFIGWYYANSPSFVERHKSNRILGSIIRTILDGVVWLLKPLFKA